jgi:beta-lactamase regulating signal transducer with metallopeptidase domain
MLPIILEAALRSMVLVVLVALALQALRVKSPHILMAAWQMVLVVSLLMPFLVGWTKHAPAPAGLPIPQVLSTGPAIFFAPTYGQVLIDVGSRVTDWRTVCLAIYLLVALLLMLRLSVGGVLTWRLSRSALPVREDWTAGRDVRASAFVDVPVTFASTILLPVSYTGWDAMQRRAVVAHESAHVSQGDFYVLLLASINRAVFWFNPAAWWLHSRIAYLAEARCDAAAIEDIEDRVRYAEILVDFGARTSRAATGLAMARPRTVRRRVERILAETMLPKKMDWKTWAAVVACILPLAAITVGAAAQVPPRTQQQAASTPDSDAFERRRQDQRQRRQEVLIDPNILEKYVGYYQLGPYAIFTIRRQGDQLFAQLTGQRSLEVFPESTTKFFYKAVRAQLSFTSDAQGRATGLVLHQNGFERPAPRIDEAKARDVEASLAKKIRDGAPAATSEAALRRQIEAFEQGQPNLGEMTDELAAATRPQIVTIQRRFAALGPLQSLTFRGVGDQGWDVYEAKFANGISICRIFLAADGKVSGLLFQWGP